MSPSSENRVYFDTVQDYFLERTGRGLILSSRDLELLLGWRRSGASAAVICQGIDEAVENLGGTPRDLHACKRFVEPRLTNGARAAGSSVVIRRQPTANSTSSQPVRQEERTEENRTEEPVWAESLARLEAARDRAERPELADVYGRACNRLIASSRTDEDPYAALYEIDDWLVQAAFESLAPDERQAIDLEIERRYGTHFALMTEEARAHTKLASRREILTKRMGLLQLAA